MDERRVTEQDLLRWSEALAGLARTGIGFTVNPYERERFEEILRIAADIGVAAGRDYDPEALAHPQECADVGWFSEDELPQPLAGRDQWPAVFAALRGEPVVVHFDAPRDPVWEGDQEASS